MKHKKIYLMLICLLIIFVFSGCEFLETLGVKNTSNLSNIMKNIDIKDFSWKTSKSDGADICNLSFINNSKYDVLSFTLVSKAKSNTSANNYYTGAWSGDMYIPSNTSSKEIPVTISQSEDSVLYAATEYATEEQFSQTSPKELTMFIVDDDNYLYYAVYNYEAEKWSIRDDMLVINAWPQEGISKSLPQITDKMVKSNDVSNGIWTATIYEVNNEEYKSYIQKVKEQGYSKVVEEREASTNNSGDSIHNIDKVFNAYNSNGDYLTVTYNSKTNVLNITIQSKQLLETGNA